MLLVGIGIGVAGVMLWQMYSHRGDGRSGLGNLISSLRRSPGKTVAKNQPAPAKPPKPTFDFYTILPETETVLPDQPTRRQPVKSKPEAGVTYILQAGSFADFEQADQLKAKLALAGLVARIQKITIEGKGSYQRVRLGPYQSLDQLDSAAKQLHKIGIRAIRLKVKRGTPG
ncbi:MAG: SPOR domain-containing protein [Sulfuricaulis sp.]